MSVKKGMMLLPLVGAMLTALTGCLTVPEGMIAVTECTTDTTVGVGVNQDGEGEARANFGRKCTTRLVPKPPQTPTPPTTGSLFGWTGGYLPSGQWQDFTCLDVSCGDQTIGYKTNITGIPDVRLKFQLSQGTLKQTGGQFIVTVRNGTAVKQRSFPYHVEGNEIVPSDKYAIAAWLASNGTGADGEQITVSAGNIPLNLPASSQTRVVTVTTVPSVNGIIVDGGAPASRTIRPRDLGRVFYQER